MAENGCDGVLPALRDLCLHDKICKDACSNFLHLDVSSLRNDMLQKINEK